MEEFLLKREGQKKVREEEWEIARWSAFQTLRPHLPKSATVDQVFPKAGKKGPVANARELRERILRAAELSKN